MRRRCCSPATSSEAVDLRAPVPLTRSDSLGPIAQCPARKHSALLLSNHGPIASGRHLEPAVDIFEGIKEASRLFLLLDGRSALSAGCRTLP